MSATSWFRRAPLWQPLAVLWSATALAASILIWADLRRPFKFLGIIPYPPSAPVVWELGVTAFRTRPVLATGVVAVPVLALMATVALCVARGARH